MTPWARLRSAFWDLRPAWRRPARQLRRKISHVLFRLKNWTGAPLPPRVVTSLVSDDEVFPHPAFAVRLLEDDDAAGLSQQTESSWAVAPEGAETPYLLISQGKCDTWPPTLLESLLLSAAAVPLPFLTARLASPAATSSGPKAAPREFQDDPTNSPLLALRTAAAPGSGAQIPGCVVPHITDQPVAPAPPHPTHSPSCEVFRRCGPWFLRGDVADGSLLHQRVRNPAFVLSGLPEVPGPRTALFLLPFLAIGGAEHLLFDLLAGWQGKYRLLVVTLEPHSAHLGQTVDRCRQLTPHVYTLGDWLPRETHPGAISHLLRRYRVEVLVSWNGTVEFYDRVSAWRREFSGLRICQQLYNHKGGWMERATPRLFAAVGTHLAVNQHIATTLIDRGAPASQVAVVHHGVAIPTLPDEKTQEAERRRCRQLLGLPQDAVVVGSFIRLHAQKRPLDIVQVARRLEQQGVHFLLAGGGPLDADLDRELDRAPLSNFTRLPLQRDVEVLYSAVDLCLSTSSYEGLPVFLLDGLARGLPCVATAVGEIPELLAQGGGVLVERPGDVEALAAGVLSFLDGNQRRAEGTKGRHTVQERFSLATYRRHYEGLLFPPQDEKDA